MPINTPWRAFSEGAINFEHDEAGVYELGDTAGSVIYIGSSSVAVTTNQPFQGARCSSPSPFLFLHASLPATGRPSIPSRGGPHQRQRPVLPPSLGLYRWITCGTLRPEVKSMPTKQPRVNIILEQTLYEDLSLLARGDEVSLSMKARDLLQVALEVEEDVVLARFAKERKRSFDRKKALTDTQARAHLRRSRL